MADSWAESRAKTLRMQALKTASQIIDRTVDEVVAIYERADYVAKGEMEERIRSEKSHRIEQAVAEQRNKLREVKDRGQAMKFIGRVKEGMDYWKQAMTAGI